MTNDPDTPDRTESNESNESNGPVATVENAIATLRKKVRTLVR